MSRLAAAARMMPNGFLRHVAVVMTGTGIAQLLTFLTAPVLSRLYDPASFGILSLYTSIASILSVIISWRYEVAIVLPEKDEDAFSLLALCIQIITGMSIAILLVVVLFGESLLSRLGMSAVLPWMWWLPLHVMAMGLAQTLTYWCTRKQDFKGVASTQMVRSVAVTGTQVTGGVLQAGAGGLIGGQAGGQLITAVMLGLHVWRKESVFFRQAFSMLQRKKVARTYRHFPLYSFPQTLLNAISQNVPPFLFMQSYGASVVGGYALALRLIEMPLSLISQSFSQVYYQQASKAYHQGESLYEKLKRTTATLALIGTIPCLVIVALGPILFATLLGAEWEKAGEYARWMVLWLFFGFLNTPSVATAQIFGLQRMMFWYELALFAARTSVLIVGIYTTDAVTSVALYSVTGGLFNLLLILFILFYGKHKVGKDTSAHVSASSDKENV